jgi:hypothetical protein
VSLSLLNKVNFKCKDIGQEVMPGKEYQVASTPGANFAIGAGISFEGIV